MAGLTREHIVNLLADCVEQIGSLQEQKRALEFMLAVVDGKAPVSLLETTGHADAPKAAPKTAAAATIANDDVRVSYRGDGARVVSCLHSDACRGKGAGRFMSEQPKGSGLYVCTGCGFHVSLVGKAATAPKAAATAPKVAPKVAAKAAPVASGLACWYVDCGKPAVAGSKLCAGHKAAKDARVAARV